MSILAFSAFQCLMHGWMSIRCERKGSISISKQVLMTRTFFVLFARHVYFVLTSAIYCLNWNCSIFQNMWNVKHFVTLCDKIVKFPSNRADFVTDNLDMARLLLIMKKNTKMRRKGSNMRRIEDLNYTFKGCNEAIYLKHICNALYSSF